MNKKIFLSILTIFSIASMASAGTWAYFSDIETSGSNALTAGTLKLEMQTAKTITGCGDAYLVPGQSVSYSIPIKNDGTVTGDLYIKMSSENKDCINYFTATTTVDGYERELGDGYIKIGTLDAGETIDLPIIYYMDKDVTEGQGTAANFVFDVLLIQQGAPAPTHP
jgi:predicted ribosomally synthesized peptide with SipW-like signal peptide